MSLTKVQSEMAGAGQVLQVVNVPFTNYTNTSSSSFVDMTGATLTITPKSATNKILITVNIVGLMKNAGTNSVVVLKLIRNGTDVVVWDALAGYTGSTAMWMGTSSVSYLDSPATTSALTYKIQWYVTSGGTFQVNNYNASPGYSTSTITAMEIAA